MQTAPPTLSTSAAAGGVAGATVVVATWILGTVHVTLPPDVAASLIVLLTSVVHFLVTRERGTAEPAAAAPVQEAPKP